MATWKISPFLVMFLLLSIAWKARAIPILSPTIELLSNARLGKRDGENNTTADVFRSQFQDPKEILTVLLLIGSDVIQKTVAQTAGFAVFTPVVFSFGWVTYAFNSVANGGENLPETDYANMLVTVQSGNVAQNKSFVLGRLLRDLERETEPLGRRTQDFSELDTDLLVTVLQADPGVKGSFGPLRPKKDLTWWSFLPFLVAQLAVSVVPGILTGNWSILVIAASGNILAVLSGSLPSIRHNKYRCREGSRAMYTMTRGAGSKYVFLILPDTMRIVEHDAGDLFTAMSSLPYLDDLAFGSSTRNFDTISSVALCILWVVLLIAVSGLDADTWYLFGVGALGMLHNILVANMPRHSESHGIPLKPVQGVSQFGRRTTPNRRPYVQEILLEVERQYPGAGHALRPLFFNGIATNRDRLLWGAPEVCENTIGERRRQWQDQFQSKKQGQFDVEVLPGQGEINDGSNPNR
jgi:hypothetical protein